MSFKLSPRRLSTVFSACLRPVDEPGRPAGRVRSGFLVWMLLGPAPAIFAEDPSGPLITASEDTTRITEPLREDGYVDYARALNDRLSRGVSTENNAAVAILRATGLPDLSDAQRADVCRVLGIELLREKGDYVRTIEQILFPGVDDLDDEQYEQVVDAESRRSVAIQRPWTREEFPVIARWIGVNEEHLARVAAAVKKKRFYVPVVTPRSGSLIEAPIFVGGYRELSRLLIARAMLRAGAGDTAGALRDTAVVARFADLAGERPFLVHYLIGRSLAVMATEGDLALIRSRSLDRAQLLVLNARRGAATSPRDLTRTVDEGERFVVLDSLRALACGDLDVSSIDGEGTGGVRGVLRRAFSAGVIDWNRVSRRMNSSLDRSVAALRLSTFAARRAELEEIRRELEDRSRKLRHPLRLAGSVLTREGRSDAFATVLDGLWSVTYEAVASRDEVLSLGETLAGLAARLEFHRLETGAFPPTLRKLGEAGSPRTAFDPFSGVELRYERRGEGYVLWSVGPDGENGVSKHSSESLDRAFVLEGGVDEDDIIVWMPSPGEVEKLERDLDSLSEDDDEGGL